MCEETVVEELQKAMAELCPAVLENPESSSDEDTVGSEDSQAGSEHLSTDVDQYQTQELESIVNSLFDLSATLESIAERVIARESRLAMIENHAEPQLTLYVGRIRDKYPAAQESTIQITAKGALDCYNRLFSTRVSQVEIRNFAPVQTRLPFNESPQQNTFKDSGIGSSMPKGGVTAASHNHDQPTTSSNPLAFIPPEIQPQSHQAMTFAPVEPSVISEATTTNESIARLIPPRPKMNEFTGGFLCPLCKNHQNINSNKTWV